VHLLLHLLAVVASSSILDNLTILGSNVTSFLQPSTVAFASRAVDRLLSILSDSGNLQDLLYNFQDHISQYSTTESASIVLAITTFLVLAMSWASRFGGTLGRFSPFTRSPNQGGDTTVSDADFSYITSDDLKKHQQSQPTAEELGPARDTDVLVLSHGPMRINVHFPAYSIARGELSVGEVREQAGKKLHKDARRVKLIFKGKTLKDDLRPCRFENLRDHDQLLCVVGDFSGSASGSDDDEDDELDTSAADAADPESAKRRRNRNKNKKRRNNNNKAKASGTSTPKDTPQQTSQQASPKPQVPTTPLGKIAAIRSTLQSFDRDVQLYLRSPPPDKAKREFEHKRLSETILTQVLLKLDAVETEGDPEARQKRKDLVRETQEVLKTLDDAAASHAAASL
jgi:hypothetical protein